MKQFFKEYFNKKEKTWWDCQWWYIFGGLLIGLDYDKWYTPFVLALWTTIAFVEEIIKKEK